MLDMRPVIVQDDRMTPTVGRIVHYYPTTDTMWPGPLAALVTKVPPDETPKRATAIRLRITAPDKADDIDVDAEYSSDPTPGCWTWPPRTMT